MQLDEERRNVDAECVENLPPPSPPTKTEREQLTDHPSQAHTLSSSSSSDDSEEDSDGGVGEGSFSPFTKLSPISPQPDYYSKEGEKEVDWEEEKSTKRKKVSKSAPVKSPTCKNNQVSRGFPRPQSPTISTGNIQFGNCIVGNIQYSCTCPWCLSLSH